MSKEIDLQEIIGELEGLKKYADVPDRLKKQEPYKHRFVYNQAIKDAINAIKILFGQKTP